MPALTLYAATTNSGKLAEFATSASGHGILVEPLPNLATIPEPVEDADTFLGNAELKAIAYSLAAPGLLVFADDSGLAVDALQGAPGVRSARYADDQNFNLTDVARVPHPYAPLADGWDPQKPMPTKDTRNNLCLLTNLAEHTAQPRTARFLCALALARDGEILFRAEGSVEGEILTAPRGSDGFGYDPLFILPALGLTFAEVPREQKWQLSHRGIAFRALLAQLQKENTKPPRPRN